MPPEALRPRTPSGLGTSGESVEVQLPQDRLRLFGGITFLIAAVFYVTGVVLPVLGPQAGFNPVGHAAMVAVLMVTLGGLVLLTPAGSIPERDLRRLVVLLEVLLLVFTRSIFIPSPARRTLAVSAVTALPLAASLVLEPVIHGVWVALWLLAAIAVATAGSAVIYGLRREVSHARQLGQYTLEEKLGDRLTLTADRCGGPTAAGRALRSSAGCKRFVVDLKELLAARPASGGPPRLGR